MGHNEMLIGRALKGRRDQALLSVKFERFADLTAAGSIDARPAAVKSFAAHSLTRRALTTSTSSSGSSDPTVPIEETVGAIATWSRRAIRAIGLSEVGRTIRRAHAVPHF